MNIAPRLSDRNMPRVRSWLLCRGPSRVPVLARKFRVSPSSDRDRGFWRCPRNLAECPSPIWRSVQLGVRRSF